MTSLLVAFIGGVFGGFVGSSWMNAGTAHAQGDHSKVLRTERLELVEKEGAVLGSLEVANFSGRQTPVLKLREQGDGDASEISVYPHSVQLKQGDESIMLALNLGLLIELSGGNTIMLGNGNVIGKPHPVLDLRSKFGFAEVSSFSVSVLDKNGKSVWSTPLKLP